MSAAAEFDRCIAGGGIALFPADTVYGLACDPSDEDAIARLFGLKRRAPEKAAAVMFFSLDAALAALPEVGAVTRAALTQLLPGGVTLLLPNPAHRFPLACAADPETIGLRVVSVPMLAGARSAVLQSSANLSGAPAPRRLVDVAAEISEGADLVLDGGLLPGTASTVVDLRRYEAAREWSVVRPGAVGQDQLRRALG